MRKFLTLAATTMPVLILTACASQDPAGNIKIDKGKSSEKVDGPVSSVMSIGAENLTPEEATSIYETDTEI